MTIEQLLINQDVSYGELINADLLSAVIYAGKIASDVKNGELIAELKSTKEDLVTKGDMLVSSMLREHLSLIFPRIVCIDEEYENHSIDITCMK